MKIPIDNEHYAEINLESFTWATKKIKSDKIINFCNLSKDMTFEDVKNKIEMEQTFLKI